MNSFFKKISDWMKEKKISPFLLGLILVAVTWILGAGLVWLITKPSQPKAPIKPAEIPKEEVIPTRNVLTGVPLAEGEAARPVVAGIMIDNHSEARPQLGLSKAALVYELPVEMGITRFLAFYPVGTSVAEVGPIRSARPYAIGFAREFGGMYFHIGGSPDAMRILSTLKSLTNVEELADGSTMTRKRSRVAPHNAFTSSNLINALAVRKQLEAPEYGGWLYRDEKKLEDRTGTAGVIVKYSSLQYEVEWRYDRVANNFVRYQARTRQKDGVDEIRAKNVVVMQVEGQVLDEVGRLNLKTIGEGKATVFVEGVALPATWKKDSADSRLRFFSTDGEEIAFVPGASWIEVVTDEKMVTVKE